MFFCSQKPCGTHPIKFQQMSFFSRVPDLSLWDRLRNSDLQMELYVDPVLLYIKRSQMRWFGHPMQMPPGPSGLPGVPEKTCWSSYQRDYLCFFLPQKFSGVAAFWGLWVDFNGWKDVVWLKCCSIILPTNLIENYVFKTCTKTKKTWLEDDWLFVCLWRVIQTNSTESGTDVIYDLQEGSTSTNKSSQHWLKQAEDPDVSPEKTEVGTSTLSSGQAFLSNPAKASIANGEELAVVPWGTSGDGWHLQTHSVDRWATQGDHTSVLCINGGSGIISHIWAHHTAHLRIIWTNYCHDKQWLGSGLWMLMWANWSRWF